MPKIEESKILYQLTVKELKNTIASAIDEKFAEVDSNIKNLTQILSSLSNKSEDIMPEFAGLDSRIEKLTKQIKSFQAKLEHELPPSESIQQSPPSFKLYDRVYRENALYRLTLILYEEIYKDNRKRFHTVLTKHPRLFSKDPEALAKPREKVLKISDSGIWGYTNVSRNGFMNIVEKLRKSFGYDETNLSVGND